ncbi:MAG: NADPH-dependent F420 reductase [Candidatus Dadabacteria bacterium]|nr:NADPH-dependent F420 reductase [Candidatus Dadabacteria bacterium]NIS09738.1 NADPH-dependent F420 reductase [Candidatus Dadabacteria bacterium]NIV41100.1 NADPH-dependent F420 reductase [Candidatus Dadabacteria bacterium]NIX16196.1 NADPH-dependent F420 reductase [Candidatus Dadabacteria bacterium]NIY22819.1 NADPH-dependent F420 reductase [Candidatus Dadabacteria bacterium]
MKISLLGGTGDIAEGLVLRWSKVGHEIYIGSRSEEKAQGIAAEYIEKLKALGIEPKIYGLANADAARESEVIIISIPPEYAAATIEQCGSNITDQIVVTPVVSMKKDGKTFLFNPPAQGSSALEIQEKLPETAKLVSAYHNLPAKELAKIDEDLDYDVVICGDDDDAKEVVKKLTEEMKNLRVLDAGALQTSAMIEAMTPLIVNLNIRYKPQHFSVKFV